MPLLLLTPGSDDQRWRDSIRQQMEAELDQRVRDALETPPPEKNHGNNNNDSKNGNSKRELENLNAHVLLDLSDKERNYLKSRRWKALQAKRQMQKFISMNYGHPPNSSRIEVVFRDELSKSNQDEYPGVFGLTSFSEGVKDLNEIHRKQFDKYPTLRQLHKQYYTKEGFLTASRNGKFPDGTAFNKDSDGSYEDKFGVIRNSHGPFWPNDWGPLFPAPKFVWKMDMPVEPLYYFFKSKYNFMFSGACKGHNYFLFVIRDLNACLWWLQIPSSMLTNIFGVVPYALLFLYIIINGNKRLTIIPIKLIKSYFMLPYFQRYPFEISKFCYSATKR